MGKKLGQHFLTSIAIAKRIVESANIQPSDTVLEVGPGKGMLTQFLVEKAKKVVAIEKDKHLVVFLKEKFKEAKNFKVIEDDILHTRYKIPDTRYRIVANLPYYITSHFLRLFLESDVFRPTSMTLMIQKEVAERICATPPHMNLLAISVQAFGAPKILFRVSRGSFLTPPEVDSAVIAIEHISGGFFKKNHISAQEFFKLPKKAFSQKRKMLRSSIGKSPEGNLPEIMATKRPQELSLEDWISILSYRT